MDQSLRAPEKIQGTYILEKLGPDWSEYSEGRDVYVSHKKIIGAALAENVNLQVSKEETKKIIDVGIILRRYIQLQHMPFDGSFNSSCLSEPVAKPLLTLLEVLLQGSKSIQENLEEDQASNSARIRSRHDDDTYVVQPCRVTLRPTPGR